MKRLLARLAALLGLVGLAYCNHFQNAFHYDDWHTIYFNPYITTLSNAGRFFLDASTFSSFPSHQSYRPLLTLSFAIDYALGGGLAPVAFHITNFVCFLGVVVSLLFLCMRLFGDTPKTWFLTAAFAIHPALAETVNYIVQRGDIIAALGCVLPLAMYARRPRVIGWHLGVFLLCCFAKPSAVVFAAILFVYVFLYMEGDFRDRLIQAFAHSTPAFVLGAAFYALQSAMNPATAETGAASRQWYWATQPWALLHELHMFLWPDALTADTDMRLVSSFAQMQFVVGAVALAVGLAAMIWACSRSKDDERWRPIALGLAWFYITNAPTSLIPLAEATNDHRMFSPAMGLVIALGGGFNWVKRWPAPRLLVAASAILFVLELSATWTRNRVWLSEESLWLDVTLKSPNNGRGLMNYGLTLMGKGRSKEALDYYERAQKLLPNYAHLETNMGIVKSTIGGRDAEAERHFQRAIVLVREPVAHIYYARFLRQRGREDDAKRVLKDGLNRQSDHWDLRWALLVLLEETQQYSELRAWLKQTRELFPHRQELQRFFNALADGARRAESYAAREASLSAAERCELARLRYMQGENVKAFDTLRPLLQENANEVCAVRVHALLSAATGDWVTARRDAEHALALAPAFDGYGRAMQAIIGEAKARK